MKQFLSTLYPDLQVIIDDLAESKAAYVEEHGLNTDIAMSVQNTLDRLEALKGNDDVPLKSVSKDKIEALIDRTRKSRDDCDINLIELETRLRHIRRDNGDVTYAKNKHAVLTAVRASHAQAEIALDDLLD